MKMRLRYLSKLASLLKVDAITIYPFVFVKTSAAFADRFLLNHERIHFRQVEIVGWFTFYFDYLKQYAKSRIKGLSHEMAYRSITYEVEAYENDRDFAYQPTGGKDEQDVA